jgi:hypothetical protein
MKLLLFIGAFMLAVLVSYFLDIKRLLKKIERIERSKLKEVFNK